MQLRAVLLHLASVAARGKRRSRDVARFMLDVDAHVLRLARALESRAYRPGPGQCFAIRDPKPRRIYALPFVDRVAQHWLMAQTLPAIERTLVDQTYACRRGRGTHACLRRAADFTRTRRFVLVCLRGVCREGRAWCARGFEGQGLRVEWGIAGLREVRIIRAVSWRSEYRGC